MRFEDLNRRDAETQREFRIPLVVAVCFLICVLASLSAAQNFPIVSGNQVADIAISENDFKVVKIAGEALAGDIELITDKRPKVTNSVSKNSIIIGTLGKNVAIEKLIQSKSIDVSQIRDKRESFLITTVSNNLVIVGSDRRGTAFGVFELSGLLGVSPWVWWADVMPEKRKILSVSAKNVVGHEPSVKYRGIFINDEDWGLQPWAAKTFEPETGNIGPKTYAKVCELLLRLKANTLWPAMHEVSTPFNAIPANRQVADDYAIVMGSSHAEPMLRNNVGEWKAKPEEFNFVTNTAGVTDYWEQRVKENGQFENIYTIGMRGIHDSAIQGPKTQAERIPLLEKIFALQRGLLSKYVRPEVETIPQIFCPYKEVLADYRAGLKVPDDVTIVFPDDNFGYIRQFPTAAEQKRKGGFGVYYHISYLGRPISYVWLNSTPPAQIFEEMSKAYNNGMRQLWIVNVGDIKPGEIGMEFFLQMAYDSGKWNLRNLDQYLENWAKREFGEQNSGEIAAIMDKYYRLGFQRKPEHLQWNIPGEPAKTSDLSEADKIARLREYADIQQIAEVIYDHNLDDTGKKNAFYELVLYPIRSATFANERFFSAEIAATHLAAGKPDAAIWAQRSAAAEAGINADAKFFNEKLAGGKWRSIMSPEMNPGQWPSMRAVVPHISVTDFGGDVNAVGFPPGRTPEQHHRNMISGYCGPFAEVNGVISIEAEHFSKASNNDGFGWAVIKGLGKTGDSVTVFPNSAKVFSSGAGPSLDYDFKTEIEAEFSIKFLLLPTQPIVKENGLRLAFSVDDGPPQMVTADKATEVSSAKWSMNVLNESTEAIAKLRLIKGPHKLHIFAVDTGVVLDKIYLFSRADPASYFSPAETRPCIGNLF